MRIQKPIRGKNARKPVTGYTAKEIREMVEQAADEFDVSKSFVISVALADFFGIKKQERYD